MPSSLIFAGLVGIWLLILVPAVARHRQEVARPSSVALSGRVLERPRRRRTVEVNVMDVDRAIGDAPGSRPLATRSDDGPTVPAARTANDQYSADTPTARSQPDQHRRVADVTDTRLPPSYPADSYPADSYPADSYPPDSYPPDSYPPDSYSADPYPVDPDSAERDPVDGDLGDARGVLRHDADERRWERPPRYRPGRGGFDPEAAALTARARYAFRQRVVLALLVTALGTAVVAVFAVPGLWWPHAVVDLALVGYLSYLRRQVRMEETIRERRAARMAGTRRPPADIDQPGRGLSDDEPEQEWQLEENPDEQAQEEPERLAGVEEPVVAAAVPVLDDATAPEPALPRLQPAPPLPLPPGTALVDADDPNIDLDDLGALPHRRAVGE